MSGRLMMITNHVLSEHLLLQGLESSELCPFSMFYDSETYLLEEKRKKCLSDEEVVQKYDYMFTNVSCLFSRRYDYILENLSLSMDYQLQNKIAMSWYQELKWHLLREITTDQDVFFPESTYLINKFIQKWTEVREETVDPITLYKELLLSDSAMSRMSGSSPRPIHLELMEKLESHIMDPYLTLTKEEYEYDLIHTPELFVQRFKTCYV